MQYCIVNKLPKMILLESNEPNIELLNEDISEIINENLMYEIISIFLNNQFSFYDKVKHCTSIYFNVHVFNQHEVNLFICYLFTIYEIVKPYIDDYQIEDFSFSRILLIRKRDFYNDRQSLLKNNYIRL